MPEGHLHLVLQLFLPCGARISQPRAKFRRTKRSTIWRQAWLYTFCLHRFLSQTATSGLHKPSLSISTRHGASDTFWTLILEKMHIIPPFHRQREGVGSWAARGTPKNAIGTTRGHRHTKIHVCTPFESKPGEGAGTRCCIFDFADKPSRPQHNTQHNGSS